MNRFLLFAGDTYYPSGGWRDLEGNFETLEQAEAAAEELDPDWWHIVDMESGESVKNNYDVE